MYDFIGNFANVKARVIANDFDMIGVDEVNAAYLIGDTLQNCGEPDIFHGWDIDRTFGECFVVPRRTNGYVCCERLLIENNRDTVLF